MSRLFRSKTTFKNDDIGAWDTSQVTTLRGTFSGASAFNQPLDGWNLSKVTSTQYMFTDAAAFDQPVSTQLGEEAGDTIFGAVL
mgnify:CR=1 FL=1